MQCRIWIAQASASAYHLTCKQLRAMKRPAALVRPAASKEESKKAKKNSRKNRLKRTRRSKTCKTKKVGRKNTKKKT